MRSPGIGLLFRVKIFLCIPILLFSSLEERLENHAIEIEHIPRVNFYDKEIGWIKKRNKNANRKDYLAWKLSCIFELETFFIPTRAFKWNEDIIIIQPHYDIWQMNHFFLIPPLEIQRKVSLKNYWLACLSMYLLALMDIDNRNFGIFNNKIIFFDNEHCLYDKNDIHVLTGKRVHNNLEHHFKMVIMFCASPIFDWEQSFTPIGEDLMHFLKDKVQYLEIAISKLDCVEYLTPNEKLALIDRIKRLQAFNNWHPCLTWNDFLKSLFHNLPNDKSLSRLSQILDSSFNGIGYFGSILWTIFYREVAPFDLWLEKSKEVELWVDQNFLD